MQRTIPGEAQVSFPSAQEAGWLAGFSPFVRQAGDGIRNLWVIEGRKLLVV